jgi:prevent-host-death family protein
MKTISVSELKARLSENLRIVKAGEEVLVTERGRAVAVLAPPPTDPDARLARLHAAGVVRLGTGRLPKDFFTRPLSPDSKGSVRRALLEEREEGW